jgi:plastocyanin domain-containing protein
MKPILSLLSIAAIAALSGCAAKQKVAAGPAEIHLSVTDRGFEPARSLVPHGQAVTLVVTRKTDQTCATEIMIPRLNRRAQLPLDQAVRIEIPAGTVTDTLNYACGMNMLGGTIVAR